jgi:hypothetical protein
MDQIVLQNLVPERVAESHHAVQSLRVVTVKVLEPFFRLLRPGPDLVDVWLHFFVQTTDLVLAEEAFNNDGAVLTEGLEDDLAAVAGFDLLDMGSFDSHGMR